MDVLLAPQIAEGGSLTLTVDAGGSAFVVLFGAGVDSLTGNVPLHIVGPEGATTRCALLTRDVSGVEVRAPANDAVVYQVIKGHTVGAIGAYSIGGTPEVPD